MSENFETAIQDVAERKREYVNNPIMPTTSEFGRWLNGELIRCKMSKQQLAKELQMSEGLVSHWLTGRRMPSRSAVIALAKITNVEAITIEKVVLQDIEKGCK